MSMIGPTLESLLRQTARIDSIVLWIPDRYRRPEFQDLQLPALPEGVELRRCPIDYGPATKILPCVAAFRGEDVNILYCDDDRIYHPDWAANLLRNSELHPGECIAEAGEVVELAVRRAFKASSKYRILRMLTFGIFGHFFRRKNRRLIPSDGRVDICHGYGGVLVRPEFFADTAFDIPDVLWTVDDVWLSGHLAVRRIPIRKVTRNVSSDKTETAYVSALINYVSDSHGRHAANLACIRYFQTRYGIWTNIQVESFQRLFGRQ